MTFVCGGDGATLMTETNTIIAACVMFVAILIAWNLPIVRDVIAGLKVGVRSGGDALTIALCRRDA